MTFQGVVGLLVLALVAGALAVLVYHLCALAKSGAYVQLWLTLATALFTFELMVRSGLVVSGG